MHAIEPKRTSTRKPSPPSVSRRAFMGKTALTASWLTPVAGHVLGGEAGPAPSDKLNIAGCGVGGKGYSDMTSVESQNIIAICDVDWRLAGRSFHRYPKAKRYKDYRVMLEKEKHLDAVIVATPDHTHAIISMAAMKLGKHVYCQKPLTHTVREARLMAETARKHKVATQMGNQGQASEGTRRLSEIVQAGPIGPIREAHIWTDRHLRGLTDVYWPQGVNRPPETPAVPEQLNWDLFLGPAPERPYHPAYTPFRWRGWWDFGTGALGDIGCHALDPVFRALKLTAPVSFQACSTLVNNETYPSGSVVQYRFPARGDDPPVKLYWYDGGLKPLRPDLLEDGVSMGSNGQMFVGDKGIILDGGIYPKSLRESCPPPPRTLPRSPGHYQEWLLDCKTGKPSGANFAWAGPLTEAVLLGNIALRLSLKEPMTRQVLKWDSKAFKITNMPEANRFLHKEYRAGWTL